ncbi:MAG: hypothetical protein E6K49_14235 [Gammaproteobacteria bacterium]|nr:MAG: hypothetical protein E6K49_14235 [Gammaproteobacteria bacterium]
MRELVVLAVAAVWMSSGCSKSGQAPNSSSSSAWSAKNSSGPAVSTPAANGAMSHVPASVADWARGARLFDGLGDFHRKVTTSSAEAQQYFDQGMRLLWAFNHDESTRSFAQAAEYARN